MRITDSILASNFLTSMNQTKESINKLQTSIYTGSTINKPSDSPGTISRVLRLDGQINDSDTFITNIENSAAFLQITTDAMQSVQDEAVSMITLFSDINNPVNASSYGTYADRVDMAITSLLNLANTQYDGRYIFGGTDFSQKPYDFSALQVTNPVTGQLTTPVIQQVNTSGVQNVRISSSVIQKVNQPGAELFGTLPSTSATGDVTNSDIFNTLIRVRDNLRNGIKPADADVTIVKNFSTTALGKITTAGETMNRLNTTKDLLENQKMELQNLLSKDKDTDVAAAVIDLQNQQYFLEMSYKMSSMILPKSLLDYI